MRIGNNMLRVSNKTHRHNSKILMYTLGFL